MAAKGVNLLTHPKANKGKLGFVNLQAPDGNLFVASEYDGRVIIGKHMPGDKGIGIFKDEKGNTRLTRGIAFTLADLDCLESKEGKAFRDMVRQAPKLGKVAAQVESAEDILAESARALLDNGAITLDEYLDTIQSDKVEAVTSLLDAGIINKEEAKPYLNKKDAAKK